MGWQDLHPQILKAYQSKGGSVRKPKGFANMDKNRHLEVSSIGGKNKHENRSRVSDNKNKEGANTPVQKLEDILTALDADGENNGI